VAILGIVEWFIFILHTYYAGLDTDKEALFAKVHFTLFYTAIFNAITSSILYMACVAATNKLWVKTEDLEINHYIELREEFERIQFELSERGSQVAAAASSAAASSSRARASNSNSSSFFSTDRMPWFKRQDSTVETPFKFREFLDQTKARIRHPGLIRRYNKLLIQVRFHELRIHFIEANNLPLKFKVSDYLRKCEQSVLIRLIHVSSFAWIVLMACINLIYFTMSMIAYGTGSLNGTDTAMVIIYYGVCGLFIMMSLLILQRVKYIFSQIMRMKLVDESPVRDSVILKTNNVGDDENFQLQNHEEHQQQQNSEEGAPNKTQEIDTSAVNMVIAPSHDGSAIVKPTLGSRSKSTQPFSQLDLFWFRNPNLIVGAIQFMQFGYAIALSLVIIFWKEIEAAHDKGLRDAGVVLTVYCLFCQGLFLIIMAQVIPRFTLCTNLGQLVNRKKLRELMANYHLEEATKRREKQLRLREDQENAAALLEVNQQHNTNIHKKRTLERRPSNTSDKFEQLKELVSKATKDLPKVARENRKPRRRRARAVSDGVAAMRFMSERTLAAIPTPSFADDSSDITGVSGISKKITSDRHLDRTDSAESHTSGVGASTSTLSTSPPASTPARRRHRKKAISEGVSGMRHGGGLFDENDETSIDSTPSQDSSLGDRNDSNTWSKVGGARVGGLFPMVPVLEDIPIQATSLSKLVTDTVLDENNLHGITSPKIEIELKEESPTPPRTHALDWGQRLNIEQLSHEAGKAAAAEEEGTMAADDESVMYHSDSDGDDIPECKREESPEEIEAPKVSLSQKIRNLMLTGAFRYMVGIFGTMTCFFYVCVRMEMLLVYGHDVYFPVWLFDEIEPNVFFWLEFTWYCIFLIEGLVMAYILLPGPERTGRADMCMAGLSGFVLSCLCLILLLSAEAIRSPDYGPFGSREEAGVGRIEPFTALIGLRFLRYRFGTIMYVYTFVRSRPAL
jgi:hypothetical protein